MLSIGLAIGLAIGLGSSWTLLSASEIYRCTDGEVTTFSDRPCDEASTVYTPTRDLSVVASPDSMASIIESNERYLEDQRAEREARRKARLEQQRRDARASRYVPETVRTVPVYPAYSAFPGRSSGTAPPANDRLDARRDATGRSRRATDESRVPLPARTDRPTGERQLGGDREEDG